MRTQEFEDFLEEKATELTKIVKQYLEGLESRNCDMTIVNRAYQKLREKYEE